MKPFLLPLAAVLPALLHAQAPVQPDPARYHAAARFNVTPDIVNRGVEPFTATIGSFGNSLWNAPFEPVEFRTRFFAAGDAPDRVVLGPEITQYDTLREGFYDGARVRVYRIVHGKMKIVRTDRVKDGGSWMSGWASMTGENVLPPDTTRFEVEFDDYNRPDATYFFSVAAVDKQGNESKPALGAGVPRPAKPGKPAAPKPEPARLRPPKERTDTEPPPAPASFKAEANEETGTVILTWDAVAAPDLAGYRVLKSDYDPKAHRGFGLILEGGAREGEAAVREGDWVVIDKTFTTCSRRKLNSNRVWAAGQNRGPISDDIPFYPDENANRTWELEPHAADTPVTDPGATCLKVSLQDNQPLRFAKFNHADTQQTWYEVLEPGKEYVAEVWLRQAGLAGGVKFGFAGPYGGAIPDAAFNPDGTWRKFETVFVPPAVLDKKGGVGQMVLEITGPGTVWIDNLRVYARDAPFLDYRPYEYASLEKSRMRTLRTHGFIKTGVMTYGMEQFTNPAGVIHGVGKGNTLPQTLAMMRRAKVHPWLQVEMHMTPEEWLGMAEFLAAPYDPNKDTPQGKPWAFKRHQQGQSKPWADEFERIYLEISNETWNWLFSPWVFESMTDAATGQKYDRGEVYGFFQEHVIDCLKASPYWEASGLDRKIQFVLGGWSASSYGTLAATRSPNSGWMTVAAYNGGWDEGEGPAGANDSSLFMVLLQTPQSANLRSLKMRQERDALKAGGRADYGIGTYEAGPGYALSGLNNQPKMTQEQVRAQEETMKSQGGGAATLDCFLDKAYYGFDLQNFFTFFHGRSHWVSHTAWHKGAVAHPPWMTLALFNREGTGDFLKVDKVSGPGVDMPKFKRRAARDNVPLAGCYATRQGQRVNLFLVSRKIDNYPMPGDDGFTPVTVGLPFTKAAKVRLHRMAGNPRAHNLDSEQVRIEEIPLLPKLVKPEFTINKATGADDRGLPPGAVFLYVFEGTDIPAGQDTAPEGLDTPLK